jgi:hypothetical protein
MSRYSSISILLFLALFLSGCGSVHKITEKEVAGEYVYRYKSGEIEVWILQPDQIYHQEFYRSVSDYIKRLNVIATNTGNWSLSENKATYINNTLSFTYPLNFFDYLNFDRPLAKPLRVAEQPADWYGASDWYGPRIGKGAKIAFSLDIDYVLFRVDSRDAVKDNQANP